VHRNSAENSSEFLAVIPTGGIQNQSPSVLPPAGYRIRMPHRELPALQKFRPWRVFLLVLVTVFTVEVSVMFVLQVLFPENSSFGSAALWDACLLTVILAPLLWKLAVQPLRQLAESRQRLLALALSAQETERGRIARDLHDGIGQGLTCMLVGLRAIEELSTESQVQLQARDLRRLGGETHDEIRRLARGLRPAVLDDAGLIPALERFLEDVRSIQDVVASLELFCDGCSRLPSDVETTLYRITQEAITNAVRHGAATKIGVILRCNQSEAILVVSDNGCGFDANAKLTPSEDDQSFGLSSIQERAWLIGGQAIVESSLGAGSRLTINIPLFPGEQKHVKDARLGG
jgi:signal transduction histidine kinase